MATSLLKLGRLGSFKCLQQESWVTLRTPFPAAFCTKAGETKKPAKKAKASSKSKDVPLQSSTAALEAPDERAALLAFKTTVAFPTRLSTPGTVTKGSPVVAAGANSAEALGEVVFTSQSESAFIKFDSPDAMGDATEATSTTKASTGGKETVPNALGSAAPKDQEATSTSSSESDTDSDSDSDSDDEKTDTTETVVQPGKKAEQEKVPKTTSEESVSVKTTEAIPEHVTSEPVTIKKKAPEASSEGRSRITEASLAEAHQESVNTAAVKSAATGGTEPGAKEPGAKEPEDKFEPLLETSLDNAATKVAPEGSAKATDHLPQAVTKGSPEAVLKVTEVPPGSADEVASEAKVEAAAQSSGETVAEMDTEASRAEELIDSAPIIADKAELPAEPEAVAASEEPVPPPEPEPFDNTTYKNLQHHSYHVYTFADIDVELTKHRLPQPSSGRPSPMH